MKASIAPERMPAEGWSLLQAFSQELGLRISSNQAEQIDRYYALLLEWNQRINLTAITDPVEIATRHFCDSLSCISVTGDLTGKRLVDVGSGAGFPGIPLKIMYPGLWLTLIDSVSKKTGFMSAVVDNLSLEEVSVVTERVEVVGQQVEYRGKFDWAVARSVAHTAVLVEYLLPLVTVGGSMIAMKGASPEKETDEAKNAISTLDGGEITLQPVEMPSSSSGGPDLFANPIRRHLVVVHKVAETPAKYPRRVGIPGKRPLGL